MIPSPKLDDREFDDIVAEAMQLIPRYAPEWTNHNASDPGVTLIELAAWMTDLILYRLNRVPEKNYVAFLNLLGIKLRPPRAATCLIQVGLVDGAERQTVPAATAVATPQAADEETVTFETERPLVVTPVEIDRCVSYADSKFADNTDALTNPLAGGFAAFGGVQRVDRFLYVSDPRFAGCGDSSVLRVFLGCPERGGRDLARLLDWEYWTGTRWRELTFARVEVDRGEVCFFGPLKFATTLVNDIEGLWLRGRLGEVSDSPEHTEIDIVRARVEVAGEGRLPDRAFANIDDAFLNLDLSKNAYPFGRIPKVDCVFYLACDDLLSTPDAEVSIEFHLADPLAVPAPGATEDLLVSWEYFDGKKWKLLGQSQPEGGGARNAEFSYYDGTSAFTQNGTLRFRRPPDLEVTEVSGEERRWLRARIERGGFGTAGTYTLENDQWIFKDDTPLLPPALKRITLRYREDYREVRHVLAYADFQWNDVSAQARKEYDVFQPFEAEADESPSLYFGFTGKLPNEEASVYLDMLEELGIGAVPEDGSEIVTREELSRYHAEREAAWDSEQLVAWEYFDGKAWRRLVVEDETKGFTTSGFVRFVAPDDWSSIIKFTEERYWLRARLEMGGYVKSPRIAHVLTNCVRAANRSTIRDELLGSSDVTPLQQVRLLHGPLLDGEVVEVRERRQPNSEDVADLGDDSVRTATDETAEIEEYWVRWKRVESFFESGSKSRHYTLDYQSGVLQFGDGRKGMIPPEGDNNIIARSYSVGGGGGGNVSAGQLTALTRTLAYVDSVTNPLPAGGGADRETVAGAKERAPYAIKSRDRAVTAEDFEMLALRASPALARARCIESQTHRGVVTLLVVPKSDVDDSELVRKLVPSGEVLRYVRRYLDERRLVGTRLQVSRPNYRDLSLRVNLLRRTVGTSERLRSDIVRRMRQLLHPLVGGRGRVGWEFGRPVLKTELVRAVEEVPGVEGVDSIDLLDEERGLHVEQIRLEPDELPFLVHIDITERVRDEIM